MRSRAKWLEEEETNSSYFFALDKRNCHRNSPSTLTINGIKCTDQKLISDSVFFPFITPCSSQNSTTLVMKGLLAKMKKSHSHK